MDETFPPPPFAGFKPAALKFFRELAENQNKAWFDSNKHIYDSEVKTPLASLVPQVTENLAKKGLIFCGDAKRAMFRINRDIRFSHDKSPYKTHAGAAITRTGAKNSPGILYFHLDPVGCFIAAGFYHPEPEQLASMRRALLDHPERWQATLKSLKKNALDLARDDTLARPPKGYEPIPDAVAEDIKLKSWVVSRKLTQKQIASAALVDEITGFALAAAPLLNFGWAALT
jgi:uncharacterized protein (TIGR02453 family)